jgi:hypothetical protein
MARVRSALATVPAAYQVAFELDRDEVYVTYDVTAGAAAAFAPALVAAVEGTGYRCWLKGPGAPAALTWAVLPVAR